MLRVEAIKVVVENTKLRTQDAIDELVEMMRFDFLSFVNELGQFSRLSHCRFQHRHIVQFMDVTLTTKDPSMVQLMFGIINKLPNPNRIGSLRLEKFFNIVKECSAMFG